MTDMTLKCMTFNINQTETFWTHDRNMTKDSAIEYQTKM